MIREAFRLIGTVSQDPAHERCKAAFFAFLALGGLCVLTSVVSHFLVIGVQTLLVLHHCISIGGSIVTRVLMANTASENRSTEYPFCFGVYRMRSVVSLAGAIFVSFGCLTTVVEGFHTAMHTHYWDPRLLVLSASVHALLLLRYRNEVLSLDRVCGRPLKQNGISPDEEQVFKVATTVPLRLQGSVLGGGQSLQLGDGNRARESQTQQLHTLPNGSLHGGAYGKVSALASLFSSVRLFLIPIACFTTSTLVYTFHSSFPDTVVTLAVALYYFSVAAGQGRQLVWGLVNNAARDPIRLNAVDRALRSVQLLDGVLQVHSTAFFMVNPCDMVGIVRLRLMSGADAAAVTSSSRKLLSEVVKHSYVECFFPSVTSGEDALSRGFGPRLHFRVGVEEGHHGHSHSADCHGHTHDHDHDEGSDGREDQPQSSGNHGHYPPHLYPTTTTPPPPFAPAPSSSSAAPVAPAGVGTAPFPTPLPARPVWDGTPAAGSGTYGGTTSASLSPSGGYRTPLVPLPVPRPVSLPAGSNSQLRPFPAPPLGHSTAGGGGLGNVTQRSAAGAALVATASSTTRVLPSSPNPSTAAPGGSRLSYPLMGGLNVPAPSSARQPPFFSPFKPNARTDKDV